MTNPEGSNPAIWLSIDIQDMDRHRNLWCPDYDRCLGLAASQSWPGWTCSACKDLARAEEDRAAELQRLIELGYPMERTMETYRKVVAALAVDA